MSNKFLPFVTKNSDPYHVFTSLISRSKGVRSEKLASLASIIYCVGIEKVKAFVESLPDLSKDQVYQEIINNFISHGVTNEQVATVSAIIEAFKEYPEEEFFAYDFSNMENIERNCFLTALACSPKSQEYLKEYTTFDFNFVLTSEKEILNDIQKYVQFEDEGLLKIFQTKDDLKAFILFHAGSGQVPFGPIRAVLASSGGNGK